MAHCVVGCAPSRLAVALRVLLLGLVSAPCLPASGTKWPLRRGYENRETVSTGESVPLPEGVNKRLTAYALAAGAALPESVSKRLTAYALAAGAAGVSSLALAEPARADIIVVTTPISIPGSLTINGKKVLSLIPNFAAGSSRFQSSLLARGACCASYRGSFVTNGRGWPAGPVAPLAKGALIGPGRAFTYYAELAVGIFAVSFGHKTYGPWANKSGYLGFKFVSNSKTDFGWAHLKVNVRQSVLPIMSGSISEFAYDTVPGQTIRAGQTSAIPEPGTLSLLALGAAGLAVLRRRKRSAVSRQQSASE